MKKLLLSIITVVFVLTLIGCEEDPLDPIYGTVVFDLIGDEEIVLLEDDTYIESGYIVRDDEEDISEFVTITNTVDNTTPGSYTVDYTLDYEGKETTLTRNVYVHYDSDRCDIYRDSDKMQCGILWSSYLDTKVTLNIYFDISNIINSEEIFNTVKDILNDFHMLSNKYDSFDGITNVRTINFNPTTTHTLDPRLFDLIQFTLDHQDDDGIDNLFNIALGPVLEVWHDYRENCQENNVCEVPSETELTVANQHTNPDDIILDEENYTITMDTQMSLDLGGVSKGYISREIIEYLDTLDLHGYLLNNGESNISTGGLHPTRDNGKFVIAATDPTYQTMCAPNAFCYATLYLGDGDQLVTSGDYQKYYMVGNELYHHIISNDTLYPERYVRAVSIVFSDPALADLYSTAIFMMPLDEGLTFVNNNDDMEAIWFNMDGTATMSEHFEEQYLFELAIDEK